MPASASEPGRERAPSRLPVHLLGGDPVTLEALLPAPAREQAHRVPLDRVEAFPDPDQPPGWVFIGADVSPDVALALLRRLGRLKGPWSPVLVGEDGTTALPLSPGHEAPLEDAARRTAGTVSEAGAISFRVAHADLSRIRHDINNPLTAALAEVQLALMDHPPGSETAQGLNVVERQIRRIRDLAGDLSAYRTHRD